MLVGSELTFFSSNLRETQNMQIAFDPVVSFAPNFFFSSSSFFRFVFFCSLKGIFQKRRSRFLRDDEVSGKNDSSKRAGARALPLL